MLLVRTIALCCLSIGLAKAFLPSFQSRSVRELKASTVASEEFEDLDALWSMEDDGEDGWGDDESDVLHANVAVASLPPEPQSQELGGHLEERLGSPGAVEAVHDGNDDDGRTGKVNVSLQPVPAEEQPQQTDTNDVAALWGMEDDEDEDDVLFPGVATEAQRLKDLRRLQRESEDEKKSRPPEPQKVVKRALRVTHHPPQFWETRLELIRDYKAKHGHIDVPYRHEAQVKGEDQPLKLGQFLHWLRSLFEGDRLQHAAPFEFVKELTDMGMKWNFLGKGRRQQLFLQRLNEWRNVARDNTMNPVLRTWMWRQRYQYARLRENLPSTLTPDRITALVDAGIIPYERSSKNMTQSWDKQWHTCLEEWGKLHETGTLNKMDDRTMLWAWEQWRMYDILLGDVPYEGDLPVMLTGFRVKKLQDVSFFESQRPVVDLVGPDVKAAELTIDWDDAIDAMRDFFFNKGNFAVSWNCKTMVGNETLYAITSRIRREYKLLEDDQHPATAPPILDKDRISQLEDLNFFHETFDNEPIQDEYEWWENYHVLKTQRRDFFLGNSNAASITSWVEEQKKLVDELLEDGGGGISEVHYEALANLGIVFETTKKTQPSIHVNEAGRPPSILKLNEDILPADTAHPRKQSDTLEDLTWKLRYEELRDFVQQKGHSFVSKSVKPKLALWANNQRLQYAKYLRGLETPINQRRVELLLEIDFDFGVASSQLEDGEEWATMIEALQRFVATNGHCFVPVVLSSNPKLGDWVNQQRQSHRCQELPIQHIRELTKIGLDLDMEDFDYYQRAFDVVWDERVDELQQYIEEHGHSRVLTGSLADWTDQQRQLYRLDQELNVKSHLTPSRIDQLEVAGFQWTLVEESP